MKIFYDCQIVLDLSTSVNVKKKQEIRKKITENGGIISYIVTKKSTHVVCNDLEKADISHKCKMATKYGLPVVSVDFIHNSVDQGKLLNTDNYILVGKIKSEELNSGKILATKYQSKEAKKKKFKIDPKWVNIWKLGDKNAPEYDEENYEVAKFAMFQTFKEIKETTWFYNLEIHVADLMDANRSDCCRFRVFSHSGSTQDFQEAVTECRYVTSSDDALHVYSYLYNELTRPAYNMDLVYQPSSRKIGSKKFQKMVCEFGMDNSQLSPPVVDLMEHIWKEATDEFKYWISIPLQSIKLEQIEKAEAILMKLKACSDKSKRKELVKEFYSSLPHRTNHIPSSSGLGFWMARKQDICQLIKDMVAVTESTNWPTISSTMAKYKALRCRVDSLDTTNAEYKEIKEHIIQSLKHNEQLNIEQIFCVRRGVEEDNFRKQLHPQKLLFYASEVQNFVGILSRGLLLPKVIVDEFRGSWTDAGMLGNGIYFESSASTSFQYSDESISKGTRMMLVSNVALGNSKSFTEFQKDLQGPPEGYDSCHGIASSDEEKSEFKDDEYVIYNTNQQVAQYLVEFSMKGDTTYPLKIDVSLKKKEVEETDTGDDIDLNDVSGIKNPLDKVQPGLVSTTGEACVLRSVHINAQLMDLSSKVVVLQEYHNTSSSTLEAKYVFPLDDMATVCGFEVFINNKHIVGEVKEKETAHSEYKNAISEGHGAYLMDQDEETHDVFTVSFGNFPPGCVALIKITYVSELQVEGELINFSIPGSVAPWKQETSITESMDGKCSIQVAVEMPFVIRTINCPTHKIKKKSTVTKCVVETLSGQNIADGFQLLIGLAEIHVPRMWVEDDEDGNQTQAAMLTFYPEFEAAEDNEIEVILVLDLSNSMKGKALLEAKKVLLLTLKHLPAHSLFNIVVFGTSYKELFPNSQTKTKSTIKTADQFIMGIQANLGNTEVYRPLHSFFLLKPENSVRNIFVISDGHVNNEETTLKAVHKNCQHTRIFTFGVSSIANKHVLKSLSRLGAGSFEYFDSSAKSKWEGKVKSQIQKASQPVLTSVSVAWGMSDSPPSIQAPKEITAVFNGSRLVVYGFVKNCEVATLKAEIGGQEISTVIYKSELSITKGQNLHRLTAKAIIRDWEDGVLSPDSVDHQLKKMDMKEYIIELSKKYSIVTQLTSFIAVEKREKDEIIPSDQQTMPQLISDEDVDFLSYIGWEGDEHERDEEEISTQRKNKLLLAEIDSLSESLLLGLYDEDIDTDSDDQSAEADSLLDEDIDTGTDDESAQRNNKLVWGKLDSLFRKWRLLDEEIDTDSDDESVGMAPSLREAREEMAPPPPPPPPEVKMAPPPRPARMMIPQPPPTPESCSDACSSSEEESVQFDAFSSSEKYARSSSEKYPWISLSPLSDPAKKEESQRSLPRRLIAFDIEEYRDLMSCIFSKQVSGISENLSSSEEESIQSDACSSSEEESVQPDACSSSEEKSVQSDACSSSEEESVESDVCSLSEEEPGQSENLYSVIQYIQRKCSLLRSLSKKELGKNLSAKEIRIEPAYFLIDHVQTKCSLLMSLSKEESGQSENLSLSKEESGQSENLYSVIKEIQRKCSLLRFCIHSDLQTKCSLLRYSTMIDIQTKCSLLMSATKLQTEPTSSSEEESVQSDACSLSKEESENLSSMIKDIQHDCSLLRSLIREELGQFKYLPAAKFETYFCIKEIQTKCSLLMSLSKEESGQSQKFYSIIKDIQNQRFSRLRSLSKEESKNLYSMIVNLQTKCSLLMSASKKEKSDDGVLEYREITKGTDKQIKRRARGISTRGTDNKVSRRSCGVPDQFKYMFEARSKHSSTQTSYRSSKTPEKEHCVLDLDDDEAFPPLLAKQTALDLKRSQRPSQVWQPSYNLTEPSYNLTDFGIGSVIIPVKKGKRLVNKYNLEKLFALQEEDGSWNLTPELCLQLGIEYGTCMNILKDAGIKSLALKVQEEIIVLLATSLTLLFMIQKISPGWVSQHVLDQSWQEQLMKWLPNKMDNPIILSLISGTKNKGTSQWSNMMTFYQRKEQEYDWTSDMLELGHCWAQVAARMLDFV